MRSFLFLLTRDPTEAGCDYYPGILLGRATLPLLCLAPRGVCRAALVARGAVGSCPTVSPMPVRFDWPRRANRAAIGGLFSVALSVRSPRGFRPPFSRGPLPCGVRTFLSRTAHAGHPTATARRAAGRKEYHPTPGATTEIADSSMRLSPVMLPEVIPAEVDRKVTPNRVEVIGVVLGVSSF